MQGCDLIYKLPLGTRPGTYSFLRTLQYLSIPLEASLSVITLCNALRYTFDVPSKKEMATVEG